MSTIYPHYYISFDTKDMEGAIKAVRVRLDEEIIRDMKKELPVSLSDHPLYPKLVAYVKANPPRKPKP